MKKLVKKPKLCAGGIECSGSTFVWQILKHVSDGSFVLKAHNYVADKSVLKFVTYRDPRDIICSYAFRPFKHSIQAHGLEEVLIRAINIMFVNFKRQDVIKQYKEDIASGDDSVVLIRYEDYFVGREKALVRMMLDKLDIQYGEDELDAILELYSIKKNKKRSEVFSSFSEYDTKTQIHGDHISFGGKSGAWKRHFSPKVVRHMKKIAGGFIIDLGYESDDSWDVSEGEKHE